MANNTQLYGLRWVSSVSGAQEPKPFRARIASGYQGTSNSINIDLRPGDPLKYVSDGTFALCAAGDAIHSVIVGIGPYYDGTKMARATRLPGGTTYGTVLERQSFVWAVPAAKQYFEISCDDAVTATTQATYQALLGENCDLSFNGVSGDTNTYVLLDISTHQTTSAGLRLVDLSSRVDVDFSGNYVPLIVEVNEVQEAPFVTTGV